MPQTTSTVLMVRPAAFGFNPETEESNIYQQRDGRSAKSIQCQASLEFDCSVAKLQQKGIEVMVVEDKPEPLTTDAVFPNNWFSSHADGKVLLYPMASPMRRLERRKDIIEMLGNKGYKVEEIIDLTFFENDGQYLEGTGSMVLDRENRVIYACLSDRTHTLPLNYAADMLGYELVSFSASQRHEDRKVPIYHTNVMMHVGSKVAVVCLDCIDQPSVAMRIKEKLQQSGKLVLPISVHQKFAFAGNMLELRNEEGEHFTVLSQTAYNSLKKGQRQLLEKFTELIIFDIPTIEKLGGGSARCMIAEVFLQPS
ncbi:citrulline utilization hydrolase CtlX [Litoribacter populi]|uniref:citrulline utilization hydrolase CtlX n=1 Tax=Litoribacter populi TaxID=2598460 RepID=UPI001F481CBB|nr:arginine deiminase-related protein [Litoribacter populi]